MRFKDVGRNLGIMVIGFFAGIGALEFVDWLADLIYS